MSLSSECAHYHWIITQYHRHTFDACMTDMPAPTLLREVQKRNKAQLHSAAFGSVSPTIIMMFEHDQFNFKTSVHRSNVLVASFFLPLFLRRVVLPF